MTPQVTRPGSNSQRTIVNVTFGLTGKSMVTSVTGRPVNNALVAAAAAAVAQAPVV
jgi:hypothetical protein